MVDNAKTQMEDITPLSLHNNHRKTTSTEEATKLAKNTRKTNPQDKVRNSSMVVLRRLDNSKIRIRHI